MLRRLNESPGSRAREVLLIACKQAFKKLQEKGKVCKNHPVCKYDFITCQMLSIMKYSFDSKRSFRLSQWQYLFLFAYFKVSSISLFLP